MKQQTKRKLDSICSAACARGKDESKSFTVVNCAEQNRRLEEDIISHSSAADKVFHFFFSVLKWGREGEWNSAWFNMWQNRLPFHFCAQQIKSLQEEMSFHPSLKEPFTQNWIAALFFLTALSLEAVVAFSNVFFRKLNIHCSPTSRSQFEGKCQRSKVRMGRRVEEHRKVTQMTTGYTQGLQNSFPEHTTHPSPVKKSKVGVSIIAPVWSVSEDGGGVAERVRPQRQLRSRSGCWSRWTLPRFPERETETQLVYHDGASLSLLTRWRPASDVSIV